MNQQQLQTARAKLWRHSNPVVTLDDASAWLEEIGLCLFLPRPVQLPAPAPSFVEACLGAASAAPPPDAIAKATELAYRLVAEGRSVPLNLLGTFSEQPDFLVTPDVLPWVAAVRGDRQWKTAPGGRTSPIVLRTWTALDQNGSLTAVEIRELLGRELTEAAVLRALIELWTTLRAAPIYAQGEPTRWSLLKTGYARQLTTAANTALPTALSALASLYLRSAIAASAEEAEIFLSPLTARSRIREMLHGMTAARQFGSLSLASQTLLFVEGSLPETPEEPAPQEAATEAAPAATAEADQGRPPRRPPFGEKPRPRREFGGKRPAFGGKPERREFSGKRRPFRDKAGPRPFQNRRDDQPRDFSKRREGRPAGKFSPRDERGPSQFRPRRDDRPATGFPQKREERPPFQRRDEGAERPRRDEPFERPRREGRPAAGFAQRRENHPWQKDRPRAGAKPSDRSPSRPRFEKREQSDSGLAPPRGKPFGRKPDFGSVPDRGPRQDRKGERPGFRRSESRGPRDDRPRRPDTRTGERSDSRRPFGAGKFRSGPPQKPRGDRPPSRFGQGPGQSKPRFGRGSGKPALGNGPRKPGFARGPAEDKPRFGKGPGKPRFGKGPGGPGKGRTGSAAGGAKPSRFGGSRSFSKPPRKNFPRSSAPRSGKPRKNRSQEESSE